MTVFNGKSNALIQQVNIRPISFVKVQFVSTHLLWQELQSAQTTQVSIKSLGTKWNIRVQFTKLLHFQNMKMWYDCQWDNFPPNFK